MVIFGMIKSTLLLINTLESLLGTIEVPPLCWSEGNRVSLKELFRSGFRHRPLQGHDHLGPRLQELLLGRLDHDAVRVAHHGDQHVEQQDGDEDLEKDKDGLCHRLIRTLAEILILKRQIVIKGVLKR